MASTTRGPRVGLRPAAIQEHGQLADIAREAYGKYLGLVDETPAPLLLDYREVAASGRCHVAASAEGILGMVTVETADPYLVLRNLAVRPSAQGQGIGRNLVALVEEMARSAGMRGVRLWTRAEMTDNIAFYQGLQYVITHSEQNEHAHRVFLCKDLKI
ncbi:GNAT family N-acetyltransferase [Streptomyces sp. NBC_00377]|uniref:GNAT family N-acetyltransferase n=1 Tax=unclassified Streptomyces TaxID=2593676 RepID=UPI002E247315|nr:MULTISPECIES: GNAT family N-acetyltransferase [unclassified Streptomyces]